MNSTRETPAEWLARMFEVYPPTGREIEILEYTYRAMRLVQGQLFDAESGKYIDISPALLLMLNHWKDAKTGRTLKVCRACQTVQMRSKASKKCTCCRSKMDLDIIKLNIKKG